MWGIWVPLRFYIVFVSERLGGRAAVQWICERVMEVFKEREKSPNENAFEWNIDSVLKKPVAQAAFLIC